ncbi:hypothetical protein P3S68_002273 [Capsicum galapagoense]
MIPLLINNVNVVIRMVKDKLETEGQKNKTEVEAAKKKVAVAEKKVKEEEVPVAVVKDDVRELKGKEVKETKEKDDKKGS